MKVVHVHLPGYLLGDCVLKQPSIQLGKQATHNGTGECKTILRSWFGWKNLFWKVPEFLHAVFGVLEQHGPVFLPLAEMLISLEKNTCVFTSTTDRKNTFSPTKQLNVDFTRTHDHRDAQLTYDRAKCWFHEAPKVRVLSPDPVSLKHYKSCRFEIKLIDSDLLAITVSVILPVSITT